MLRYRKLSELYDPMESLTKVDGGGRPTPKMPGQGVQVHTGESKGVLELLVQTDIP